ncbi:MAG: hypothetical protein PVI26_11725 [Chitinispirillia bacterium]|jgi:hypothetical protein
MNKKIFEGGIEKTKIPYIIFENVLIFALLFFGYSGMKSISIYEIPILSIIYILFSLSMLIFFLRKHLCTHCYYYGKSCHCGWGLLSSNLFKKESGNQKIGGILAGVTWGIIMILPIIVMIILIIIKEVKLKDEVLYLVPFIILTGINGLLHKIDCDKCKMKYICPGSASKK